MTTWTNRSHYDRFDTQTVDITFKLRLVRWRGQSVPVAQVRQWVRRLLPERAVVVIHGQDFRCERVEVLLLRSTDRNRGEM